LIGLECKEVKELAWISYTKPEEAVGELSDFYEQVKNPYTGKVDNILQVHTLNLPALKGLREFYKATMFGKSNLRRDEREMIALVVSSANQCNY
jgi:alkylhydroperoxidase family enzyme